MGLLLSGVFDPKNEHCSQLGHRSFQLRSYIVSKWLDSTARVVCIVIVRYYSSKLYIQLYGEHKCIRI